MKKPTLSEATKRIHQREKRAMARRMGAAEAARIEEARMDIYRAGNRAANRATNINRDAVFNAIHSMVSSVAKSWGVGNAIHLKRAMYAFQQNVAAWTDFTDIHVQYPESSIAWSAEVGSFDENKLRTLVSDIKGLAYHEVGHIRFTVPFPVLCDLANFPVEQRSPRLRQVWNVLEDQRMESAVVAESPQIAAYFTTMVYLWLLRDNLGSEAPAEQFVLLAGRRYLPRSLRDRQRAVFVAKYGEDVTSGIEGCIRRYKAADTPEAMIAEVNNLYVLLSQIGYTGSTPDRHDDPRHSRPKSSGDDERDKINKSKTEEQDEEQPAPTPDPDASDDGEGEQGEDEQRTQQSGDEATDDGAAADSGEGDTEGGEDAVDSDGDEGSDEGEDTDSGKGGTGGEQSDAIDSDDTSTTAGGGSSSEATDPDPINRKEIEQMLNDSRQNVVDDQSINDVIRDVYERANTATSSLSSAVERSQQQPVYEAKAEELAAALIPTLEVFTAEKAPLWLSHQQRGVIDPFVYRTRPSGSNEYRRQYADEGNSGIDIAVTLMLDISTSMRGSEAGLGAAGYASKRACDVLGIPCTVTCFNHGGYILWGKDDAPEHLSVICDGGTSPRELMEALDEQVYDRGTHLVVLMTDGIFEMPEGTAKYRSDDCERWFVGLAYGSDANPLMLQQMGFDFSQTISDLMQIPEILGSFVASFLR